MTNFVKLVGGEVEIPHLALRYAIAPPWAKLKEGLAAWGEIQLDIGLQTLPVEKRDEVTRFVRQWGQLLYRTVFPAGQGAGLDPKAPVLLQLDGEWEPFPWELLHDGQKWLGLDHGVARRHPHPASGQTGADPHPVPLRVAGVTARPLPGRGGEVPPSMRDPRLSPRFVSVVDHTLDPCTDPHYLFQSLPHATLKDFEALLKEKPHLLLFSGYTSGDGWLFETPRFGVERSGLAWLVERMSRAARDGLRMVVLNDSSSLVDPETAARQARVLLEAGIPAVAQFTGRLTRMREQEYLRALVRGAASSGVLFEAHLSAVKRLHHRAEQGWDWAFPRLTLGSWDPQTESHSPLRLVSWGHSSTGRPPGQGPSRMLREDSDNLEPQPLFARTPPPPVFTRRQRVFGRRKTLPELAAALAPPEISPPEKGIGFKGGASLVFLTGPAGCGKTVLALDAARRMRRRFGWVVYLSGLDRPPDPPDGPSLVALPSPPERLMGQLIRQLEAHDLLTGPVSGWGAALAEKLNDGIPRLILIDRLEHHPGYQMFAEGLARFPANCRIVLIGRQPPPLLPGVTLAVKPASHHTLEEVFDRAFLERLKSHPNRGLLEACRKDLLLARLLWRLAEWPDSKTLGGWMGAGSPTDDTPPALWKGVLGLVLAGVDEPGGALLKAMALFPHLVERETLLQMVDLDEKELESATARLQWMGLLEAYDGGRYFALHPRVQPTVGLALADRQSLEDLLARGLRSARSYLVHTARILDRLDSSCVGPACAWRELPMNPAEEESLRTVHRLGVERVNLGELGGLLFEAADGRGLERLALESLRLARLPAVRDVGVVLGQFLAALGGGGGGNLPPDSRLEAQGFRIAAGFLTADGRLKDSLGLLETAASLLNREPDWELLGAVYLAQARCQELSGNWQGAANQILSAVELAYQTSHGENLVEALTALARLASSPEKGLDICRDALARAVEFLTRENQRFFLAQVQRLLGNLYLAGGAPKQALQIYREALEKFRKGGSQSETGLTLLKMAKAHMEMEDTNQAQDCLMTAQKMVETPQGLEEAATVLEMMSRWYEKQGRREDALKGWLQIRKLHSRRGNRSGVIRVLDILGGIYYQMGDQENSTRCYQERLGLLRTVGGDPAPLAP
ncbi:MAG: hypothetical protein OEW12_04270 [Deltaproteobacteria bacterium]|nr:hypothetical protein [Deltaproteobacteria bacterium]